MKTLAYRSFLALASVFLICSCADSKDKVVDDMADLIEETAQAALEGDQAKMEQLQKEAEEIKERADALGINLSNPTTLSEEQVEKLEQAGYKALNASFDKLQENLLNNK